MKSYIALVFLFTFCYFSLAAAGLNGTVSAEVSCIDSNNGSITMIDVTVDGGFSPYDFEWSDGSTTEDIEVTAEGDYSLTVTDALCGEAILIIPVTGLCCQDCYLIDANVGEGSIFVDIECQESNGFTYEWSDGATGNPRTNLEIGNYCVTATSNQGCVQTGCWDVTTDCTTAPVTDSDVAITHSCYAAPMSGLLEVLSPQQNLYYFWTGPNNYNTEGAIISNLFPGEYCLSITGDIFGSPCPIAAGCFTIEPDGDQCCDDCYPIEATIEAGQIHLDVECQDTGGFTYTWSDGGTGNPRKDLELGVYCVTISGSINTETGPPSDFCSLSGCWEVTEACLDVVDLTDPSLASYIDISCSSGNNGFIVLSNDLPSYLSYPDAFTIWTRVDGYYVGTGNELNNMLPGEYCVAIQPSIWGGCVIAEGCFVIGQTDLVVGIDNINNPEECDGYCSSSISLSVSSSSSNLTYEWTGPDGFTASGQNIFNVCVGDYSVTVSDGTGCSVVIDAKICCCNWDQNSQGNAPDDYCFFPNFNLPPLEVTLENITQLDSDNGVMTGSIDISTNQPSNPPTYYTWIGPNGFTGPTTFTSFGEDISNVGEGRYCVSVDNGCQSVYKCYYIVDCPTLIWDFTDEVSPSCPGADVGEISISNISISRANGSLLEYTGPYTFSLGGQSNTTGVFTGLAEGEGYTLTIYDETTTCSTIVEFDIKEVEPNISWDEDNIEDTCPGLAYGSITLNASGDNQPYTYEWSQGGNGPEAYELGVDTYFVTITDSNGCAAVAGPFDVGETNEIVDDQINCITYFYCNDAEVSDMRIEHIDASDYDPNDCRFYLFQCRDPEDPDPNNVYPYIPEGETESYEDRSTIVNDFVACETRVMCEGSTEPYSTTPGELTTWNTNSVDDGVGPDGCLYCFTAIYCTLIVDDEEETEYVSSATNINIIATTSPGTGCDVDNTESCFVNIHCSYLPVGQDIIYPEYCSPDCDAYNNENDFLCTDVEIEAMAKERATGTDNDKKLEMNGFAVKVYPNPFYLDFYCEIESNISRNVSLKIVNTTGSLIQELDFHVVEGINVMPNKSLSNQATGVYFLIFSDKDNANLITLPIVKQ